MNLPNQFDEDYYERGVETHKSGYTNYRFMPERSYSEAVEIIKKFPECNSILDFGAAKGFLVHALRQLGKEARGEDISEYAINNATKKSKPYLKLINTPLKPSKEEKLDLVIAKDVLEHVPENKIIETLIYLKSRSDKYIFAVIPLGDNNLFRIREYEVDITHVTKKDEDWWIDIFKECDLKIKDFSYSFGAIKEKWTKQFPYGNGFFTLGI